jgi:hypothetical protein
VTIVLVCSIITILVAAIPDLWLFYLISLHTYLIVAKKSTIQLILESRSRNRIKPEGGDKLKNQIFKITFARNSVKEEIGVRRVGHPEREEDIENSNSETNNNLMVGRESKQEGIDIVSIYKNRSLPPVKNKVSFNIDREKDPKSLMSCSQTPSLIRRGVRGSE